MDAATSNSPRDFEANGISNDVVKILSIGETFADSYRADERTLATVTPRIEFTCVKRLTDALERLGGDNFDIILVDLATSGASNLDVFGAIRGRTRDSAIVFVSNECPSGSIIRAFETGVADGALNGTAGANFYQVMHNAWESTRVQEALRESEDRYRKLLRSVTSYVYTVEVEDGHPMRTRHGPGCAATTGYSPKTTARMPISGCA